MTDGAPTPSLRRRVGQVASVALLAGVLVFTAFALERNWDAVREDLERLSVPDLVLATAATGLGLLCMWASWHWTMRSLGAHLRRHDSRTIFYSAQLGKYVPGSVWPAVIQAQLGRRNGVARSTSLSGYVVYAGLLVLSGTMTGALVSLYDVELPRPLVVLAAVVAAGGVVVLLHDRGAPKLLSKTFRRLGRSIPDIRVVPRPATVSITWCFAAWAALGLSVWFIARPLGADAGDLPLSIGAFALAFVVGLIIVPLPAGAGVREAVLVLTLGAAVGRPGAITVALVSRFAVIVVEILLALVTGVPATLRHLRTRGTDLRGPGEAGTGGAKGGTAGPGAAPGGTGQSLPRVAGDSR